MERKLRFSNYCISICCYGEYNGSACAQISSHFTPGADNSVVAPFSSSSSNQGDSSSTKLDDSTETEHATMSQLDAALVPLHLIKYIYIFLAVMPRCFQCNLHMVGLHTGGLPWVSTPHLMYTQSMLSH